MKEQYINKFGTKLLAASKSVNKIPYEYMKEAFNARIYDGGIGPRRGKELVANSTPGTSTGGGFFMDGELYQIANSKIYLIDKTTGTATEKADLGYDAIVDTLVFQSTYGEFIGLGEDTFSYDGDGTRMKGLQYDSTDVKKNRIDLITQYDSMDQGLYFSTPNSGNLIPAVKIIASGTTSFPSDVIMVEGGFEDFSSLTEVGDILLEPGYYKSKSSVIIVSDGQPLKVFDGDTISTPITGVNNNGMIEYTRGFGFLANKNVLYISAPLTPKTSSNLYDFVGDSSEQITYKTDILGLKGTLNGLYVFTEDRVEYIGANSLQSVAGSATFISSPIGDGGQPISNRAIVASGDKIFYITKNQQLNTINYVSGIETAQIGELSQKPIIGIKKFLKTMDEDQDNSCGFYNKNDETIHFHIREEGETYNSAVLVYDMVNNTYIVDTGKNYGLIVENNEDIYGFSDIDTSIYKDDIGEDDAGTPIEFKITTQAMNYGNIREKLFGGLMIAGSAGEDVSIRIRVLIDGEVEFDETITQETENPFDIIGDESHIYRLGTRGQIEISSNDHNFLVDTLGLRLEQTNNLDISNRF